MTWDVLLLLMGAVLTVLLVGGVWIPVALGVTGIIIIVAGGYSSTLQAIGSIFWNQTGSFVLLAIPLFILMGEIILASGVSGRFYRSISPWIRFLPGGLLNSNVVASALFAAVSGSSVATAAAIGTVAIPELRKRGYNDRINYGTIAAGGALGILIPPSAAMIIYGSMVNENIARLFIAGIVPGLLLAAIYIAYVMIICLIRKDLVPADDGNPDSISLMEILRGMLPLITLIIFVIGGIYRGIVTPTEAAALGVFGAIIVGMISGRLSWASLAKAVQRSVLSTAMILFIILGAQILSFALARTGISRSLVDWVVSIGLGPWEIFVIICMLYLVLGCFIDAISMMVLTLPLVHPIIVALGFDPIWFGVILVLLIEIGLITPPIGLNLFVIQGFAGKQGEFKEIAMGALPFVALNIMFVVILCLLPQLVLWLPDRL
jgi:C4-dicarboxylate transporter, DctM subunit